MTENYFIHAIYVYMECISHKHITCGTQKTTTWKWHQSISHSAKYKKECRMTSNLDYTQAWNRGDVKWHKPHLTRGFHKPRVKIEGINVVQETNSGVRVCTEAERKEK